MQSVSSRIWTRVAMSISYDDNHYTTGNSTFLSIYANFSISVCSNIYIYIYIYCPPQTDCFVEQRYFSVARHVGRFKQRLKPNQLFLRLIPLSHQTTYFSLGIRHYVVAFICLHLPYRIPESSIHSKSFALCEWQPLILSTVLNTQEGSIYIYLYIYIYIYFFFFFFFFAGLDEIPPEVWKTRQFDDILLRHCNAVYNQNPIDRWTKGCILPFPKKGDLGLAKNYRGITLTSIAAKIYNALLRNRIEPKIDNILRKNQNGFRRNRSTTSQILTIRRILEGVRAKNIQATLIFVDFTKAFDSIHRGKMEQILLAYGIPKETVAAITILYRNTKVKVRSPDGDTEYFDIVAGVLQGDTLAPYLFIICLDYVLKTSIDKIKENGFELTKKRSRRYPATTITDADYADDIAILANTPDQAETLLHSLERAAASIGLHVNAHKTEYMCYNQTGDISTLEGTPLKLVDKFTYLGSSVESTEKDIETRLTKAWTAINRLSTIWKSDLTDKMKRSFFQAAVTSILLYGCTTWTLTKRLEKKLDGNYTRMLRAILNKSWQRHPTRHQLYGHLPPITKSIQVRRTRHAGHCWRSRDELIRDVLLWIPTHGRAKAGRPARTYIQQLCEDTGCCPEDLPRAMNDREEWRERVRDIRAASTIWWWWWWYIYIYIYIYISEGRI